MDFELDHLFVCADHDGPEAEQLVRLGLVEGLPNVHPGQGTANRRFFFDNAMLELLWVCHPDEAQAEPARPLRLWERWSGRRAGACPFGICLRQGRPEVEGLPFAAWPYRPVYLPAPLCLYIGESCSSPQQPLLFYLPLHRGPDQQSMGPYQRHPLGVQQITRVLVCGPSPPAPDALGPEGIVAFAYSAQHVMEIGFDSEKAGRCADLRPLLPLLLRW